MCKQLKSAGLVRVASAELINKSTRQILAIVTGDICIVLYSFFQINKSQQSYATFIKLIYGEKERDIEVEILNIYSLRC